jgi:hypothetical protein
MRVTSSKSITFPKIGWGISAGETKELPRDKAAQDRILAEDGISVVRDKEKKDALDD